MNREIVGFALQSSPAMETPDVGVVLRQASMHRGWQEKVASDGAVLVARGSGD